MPYTMHPEHNGPVDTLSLRKQIFTCWVTKAALCFPTAIARDLFASDGVRVLYLPEQPFRFRDAPDILHV